MPETKGITMAAAKYLLKLLFDKHRAGEDISKISIESLAEENNLWMADEWTHIGHMIIVSLDNEKLISAYNKGNKKTLDALLGKTIKNSNMTVSPDYVREMLPVIIQAYFSDL